MPSIDGLTFTGSIPAWAGKPHQRSNSLVHSTVYPRVGGETLRVKASELYAKGLSPRGRGNHVAIRQPLIDRRSIPAWAGKPDRGRGQVSGIGVYPRVGGETQTRRSRR